jgi:hypothetical protein
MKVSSGSNLVIPSRSREPLQSALNGRRAAATDRAAVAPEPTSAITVWNFAEGWKEDLRQSYEPALLGIGLPTRETAMQAGSPDRVDRRLAAILAADVVGYSRLMEADEAGTARLLRDHRSVADALVTEHGGRIVKTTRRRRHPPQRPAVRQHGRKPRGRVDSGPSPNRARTPRLGR